MKMKKETNKIMSSVCIESSSRKREREGQRGKERGKERVQMRERESSYHVYIWICLIAEMVANFL